MLAMGPRDLNSAPYSPVHCSSHSMTSFQSSELTELPVVENSQLFAQRAHSACTAHGTPPYTCLGTGTGTCRRPVRPVRSTLQLPGTKKGWLYRSRRRVLSDVLRDSCVCVPSAPVLRAGYRSAKLPHAFWLKLDGASKP